MYPKAERSRDVGSGVGRQERSHCELVRRLPSQLPRTVPIWENMEQLR
jgi:hypothetical protein